MSSGCQFAMAQRSEMNQFYSLALSAGETCFVSDIVSTTNKQAASAEGSQVVYGEHARWPPSTIPLTWGHLAQALSTLICRRRMRADGAMASVQLCGMRALAFLLFHHTRDRSFTLSIRATDKQRA